ncbi:MAG: hypothetical protein KDD94_09130 [Calditrichaeota bacterium]|nr:hypothetical protein [Calditrichota bacterium]
MAIIGTADHSGWAIAVTVDGNRKLIDRRKISLLEEGLPILPIHHDAQELDPADAETLVDKVRVSAEESSKASLEKMLREISVPVNGIVIRKLQEIPDDLQTCIRDYRINTFADSVMYRKALMKSAEELGLAIYWYERKTVFKIAQEQHPQIQIEPFLTELGKTLGPPWQKDHRMAMAAAMSIATDQ